MKNKEDTSARPHTHTHLPSKKGHMSSSCKSRETKQFEQQSIICRIFPY